VFTYDWGHDLGVRVPAKQVQGPEFKPQYHTHTHTQVLYLYLLIEEKCSRFSQIFRDPINSLQNTV
jgi:hypothetical protein